MRLFLTFLLLLSFSASYSQTGSDSVDSEELAKPWRGLMLDLGLNGLNGNGNYFQDYPKLSTWGSRSVNIAYYFGIRLSNTFTIAPGIGLGFDNYMFKSSNNRINYSNDSVFFYSDSEGINNKKSKLAINQIDVPLELRFKVGKKPSNTFRLAFGVKGGIIFNAHTKIKYERASDGETVKEKKEDDFALTRFRYGLIGRIGYSYLNFFGYYSLSNLFNKQNGPEVSPITIGISISPNIFFDL